MRKISNINLSPILLLSIFLLCSITQAQVGINTMAPNGLLDLSSSTYGVVYPNVSLTATNVSAPVTNPNSGSLVAGTVVYNINTTSTGAVTDVHPGVYVWDGSKWTIHFKKRQANIFEQSGSIRTSSNAGWEDVTGLGVAAANSFTAKYSGMHKIEVKTNFGGGDMIDNGDINVGAQEGNFRFTFDGTAHVFSTKSYSTYNDHVGSGTNYSNVWKESYITVYVSLTAGASYSFYLEFDQLPADGFVNDGDSGDGRGYIGEDISCFIEFTYLDE